jgi:hypothetical protein
MKHVDLEKKGAAQPQLHLTRLRREQSSTMFSISTLAKLRKD